METDNLQTEISHLHDLIQEEENKMKRYKVSLYNSFDEEKGFQIALS